jgi:hypothetical protein
MAAAPPSGVRFDRFDAAIRVRPAATPARLLTAIAVGVTSIAPRSGAPSPMPDTATHDIHLELSGPDELFTAPRLDPLGGQPHADSGIQRILNRIRPHPGRPVRTTLHLPAATQTPDLEVRLRSGLQQYSDVRDAQIANDLASLRQEGLATLARGVLFLALCMIGSWLLGESRSLPAIVTRFLEEGLVIAGWVALWYPLDALLYQRWPLKRERHLNEQLRRMDLRIEFAG